MYNVGDLVVYSSHGICRVDDICEKTLLERQRNIMSCIQWKMTTLR